MKALKTLLCVLALAGVACATRPGETPEGTAPETAINASAHYLDNIFMNTRSSLELVASTPEAERGEWEGIKPYLKQLASDLPGVYFFVLPNGNYYSLELDYTHLNLKDRAYFDSLFAGNPVEGFPIYSRSSGKKSALMAVPIVTEGRVTGALGASVFLDDLHAALNEDFALPPDTTWFVLNSEGAVMLDRDRDFIFMNALNQGSPSLKEGAAKALTRESGAFQYESRGLKHAHYRKLPAMDWWMFLAKTEGGPEPAPPALKLSLERFVPDLQNSLNAIDTSLANLIERSDINSDNEAELRPLLRSILNQNPHMINVGFIDPDGVLRYLEPSEYANFENSDISDQKQVVAMRENPRPLFSEGFTAVEGFLAVDIERPLRDDENNFIGAVTALIRPSLLAESLVRKRTIPEDYELWIMQPDGLLLYDQNEEEIGRNLFTDPLYANYENLQKLGAEIVAAPSGEGSYIFASPETGEEVIKDAVWETVRLHGQEWRVVLAYRPYE